MNHYVHNWTEADALLGARPILGVANNTKLRRADRQIEVVLHDTAVVTYLAPDRIRLATGGWYTRTTADRINAFTPTALRLYSDRGRWMLRHAEWDESAGSMSYGESACFAEDIEVGLAANGRWQVVSGGLPEPLRKTQDIHNARVTKLMAKYLRTFRQQPGRLNQVDCVLCVVPPRHAITTGDLLGDTQHLMDHLLNLEEVKALRRVALAEAGYRPDYFYSMTDRSDIQVRALRAYFRSRLIVGAVATNGGRRPLGTASWHNNYHVKAG